MNRPPLHPDNSAEMLELIAKVTASISERMDAQDKTIEEIRLLGREANAQIIDRMPHTLQDMKAMERKLATAEETIRHGQRQRDADKMEAEQQKASERYQRQRAEGARAQYTELYCTHDAWKKRMLLTVPIIILLLALILPTFLSRHPLTCETMGGTWQDQENGYVACYFLSQSD